MAELGTETITRTFLGRFGFIGELYNARSESLSSRSLFKSSLPSNTIECQDICSMDFDYKFTENISDSFDLIKIEPELQVGVLCDIITLDGSGKFLTNQKKSYKTVSSSLICKFRTVCEKFYAAWSEIIKDIDLKALEDDKYTHVVSECYWGANCVLSVESFCNSEAEKQEIKAHLGANMKILPKLFTVKGDGEIEKVKLAFTCKNDIQIKVNADIIPEDEWPTTIEGFCKLIKAMPNLLKKFNGGKGKPLKYVMIPLTTIRKMAKVDCAFDNLVVKIGESFLLSTVYFFDEIAIIKGKFYDHLTEMKKYRKYILDDDYQNAKAWHMNLLFKESTLKQLIADNWTSVRSGAMPLKDLIKNVEKLKNQLPVNEYESYLQDNRVNFILPSIKNYLSRGIICLGIGETFSKLLAQNPSSEFIVFLTSGVTRETELGVKTLNYFLTLKEQSESNIIFAIIDLDYGTKFFEDKLCAPVCVHLKGSEFLSLDLYGEYVSDQGKNFAQPKEGSKVEYDTYKPGNRVLLEMVCPNFQENICSSETVEWICFRCKSAIEYGFDDFFYCSCGKCLSSSFSFRCGYLKHGNVFVTPKDEFLKTMLSKLRPLKTMNLLILGQSGVGKSTWINGIVNYLNYETLEDAEKEGVICTIPSTFTMYDPLTSTSHFVSVGVKNKEEDTSVGNSGTQASHTYTFLWKNMIIRLIDTPGLGDTRGISQDKENIMNVMTYIENISELHGVCILLKASDNRSTSFFSYCLKELLVHLHRSVTKNIVFCFTNVRNTFYAPGQVAVILEKLINNLGIQKELALGRHNTFCFDNESFLFLCSLKHPKIHYEDHLKGSFNESWKISQRETERLFQTIQEFPPHKLKETSALFAARNWILAATKPLANISKLIQVNLTLIKAKQKEIEQSKINLENLSKRLTYNEIRLEPEPLGHPRTVCTKPSCVDYVLYKSVNVTEIEYKTHCHEFCQLNNVRQRTLNCSALRFCSAMCAGLCLVCGCSWEYHMHIEFVQKRVEREVKRREVEGDMEKEESVKKKTKEFLEELESKVEKFKKEQEIIIQATIKFGTFLKQNAITVYNDSLAAYLQFLIQEEENKPHKTEEEHQLLQNMKDNLAHYEEQVKVFEGTLSRAKDTDIIAIDEVQKLQEDLYKLELTGESIKSNVEMARKALSKLSYRETPILIKPRVGKKQSFATNVYQTAKSIGKIPQKIITKYRQSTSNYEPNALPSVTGQAENFFPY